MPDVSKLPLLPAEELLGPEQLAHSHIDPIAPVPGQGEPDSTPMPSCTPDEAVSPGLVRDSSGQAHHIGPTGSLAFYASLRHLISSRFRCNSGDRHASFARDSAARTLESGADQDEDERPEIASPDSTTTNQWMSIQPDMREEEKRLPPTQHMNELMQAYFENVHLDLPLFHRASFEEEYECFVLAPRSGRSITSSYIAFPDSGWGWLACLHLILVFGSLTGPEPHSAPSRAFRRQAVAFVRAHLSTISTKSSLWNVRCLVLLSLYLHNNSERNAAYLVAGTAVRCALALGLHKRDLDNSFRPIEREMRKRAFCSLYAYEQFLCSTLGRPSGMGDPDIELTAPKEGFLYNGNTIAELSAASVELQKILFKARWATVARADILEALRAWKAALPDFLDLPRCLSLQDVSIRIPSTSLEPVMDTLRTILSHQPPARVRSVLLLHIQYHYIVGLVTRAALLQSVASSYGPEVPVSPAWKAIPVETAESCVYHAAQTSVLITLLHEFKLLRGESGLDVFYGYSAGMLLYLRLLQRSELQRERQVKLFLHNIAERLRSTLRSTPKSPTMTRFASVLESFASLHTSINDSTTITRVNNEDAHAAEAQSSLVTNVVVPTGVDIFNGHSAAYGANSTGTAGLDACLTPMGNHHNVTAYDLQGRGTFDELPNPLTNASWTPFGNDLDFGWADFEGLLNGNGLFVP